MSGFISQFRAMDDNAQQQTLQALIEPLLCDLVHDDPAASLIAETNAFGWMLDVWAVRKTKVQDDGIHVELTYSLCGDQDDEKGACGDEITGEVLVEIDDEGKTQLVQVGASLNWP